MQGGVVSAVRAKIKKPRALFYFRSAAFEQNLCPYVGIIRIRSIGRNVSPFPLSRIISSLRKTV